MGVYSDRDQWHGAAGHLADPVVLLQIQVRAYDTQSSLSAARTSLEIFCIFVVSVVAIVVSTWLMLGKDPDLAQHTCFGHQRCPGV